MDAAAVIFEEPGRLRVDRLPLVDPEPGDLVCDIEWSGVSTGTERLLWTGRMPPFPGMGYPLVPGYEAVGRVVTRHGDVGPVPGETVFVPGARCFGPVRGLFGAAAGRLVVKADRVVPVDAALGDRAVLLALAATARHAFPDGVGPDLIVGHGVLGRLIARLAVLAGGKPTVWERRPERRAGATGYQVIDPAADTRRDYRSICDASGDADGIDGLVERLTPGGELVLAGFYDRPVGFDFVPAFLRELRLRVSAEWKPADLAAVAALVADGRLSLDGLVSHHVPAAAAADAYRTAFDDADCLKMVLDWRGVS
jgi:3-hydroxyethyl bacteriochlorophyllide a dehydrogenase